jgi:hypothetical protein
MVTSPGLAKVVRDIGADVAVYSRLMKKNSSAS